MKRPLSFLAVLLASALIGWLGGYDFDYRSGGVAIWALFTLVLALLAGMP